MRALIESFDNAAGDASACRVRILDERGQCVARHETKFYRAYPRSVRAFTEAKNFAQTFARSRLMTCVVERV